MWQETAISKKVVGKKCTRTSRKVLWVVLSSLFFKEIWENGTRGHGNMSESAKGKQQKRVRKLQCQEQWIDRIPYYLSGLSRANFFDSLSRNSCISGMRRSVSSPHKRLRRELKKWRAEEYFWRTSRCFIWWWNTVSNAWYYFSNKTILEGQIKDAKMSSFPSVFQTLININFLCIFFINY